MACIFCQIAAGKKPVKFEYQDEELVVFNDRQPQAPLHFLIVPRRHVKELIEADDQLLMKMIKVARQLIKKHHLDQRGYRLVVNGGGAAQVDHLHLHLLGGITSQRRV